MFETLLNLVKEHAGDAIVNNPAIPNEKNDDAIKHATTSIVSGLQSQLASGKFNDVINLLGGKSAVNQNPSAVQLSQNVATDLASKFGLTSSQAGSMVASLLPGVLGSLVSKTNDPNDKSVDLNGIFNTLTNGKSSGIDFGNVLKNLGSDSSTDDIAGKISGSAKEAMGGMDIGGMLGGLFGK